MKERRDKGRPVEFDTELNYSLQKRLIDFSILASEMERDLLSTLGKSNRTSIKFCTITNKIQDLLTSTSNKRDQV